MKYVPTSQCEQVRLLPIPGCCVTRPFLLWLPEGGDVHSPSLDACPDEPEYSHCALLSYSKFM